MKIIKITIVSLITIITILCNVASAVTLRFVQTDDSPVNHHNPFHSYTHVLDIKVVTNKQTFNNHIEDPLNIQQEKQLPYGQSSSPL